MSDVIVRATSDLHGELPEIEPCDLLLVAGDVCPSWDHSLEFQRSWIEQEFAQWLEDVPAKRVVWIAGNHDYIMEWLGKDGNRKIREEVLGRLPSHTVYLQDWWTNVFGLKIYGTPWSLGPDVDGWAFEAGEPGMGPRYEKPGSVSMEKVVRDIPTDADIVLSHGPASGFGDRVGGEKSFTNVWLGSEALTKWLRDNEPKLCVTGHNHCGHGRWDFEEAGMTIVNASLLNDSYAPVYPVEEFVL